MEKFLDKREFKLWSELHPEIKPKIKRALKWFYFKKAIKRIIFLTVNFRGW